MNLEPKKFSQIKAYVGRKQKLHFKHVLIRLAIIKDSKILREYDFLQGKMLNRQQAKNKYILQETFRLLKLFLVGELGGVPIIKQSFWDKLKSIFEPAKTFITSDLHLDHTNIIKLCRRPFTSKNEMNRTLFDNWNSTIRKKDTVYFLGDLKCGRGSRPTDYWFEQLNGHIIFIEGTHDESNKIEFFDNYILKHRGIEFYLTHDPADIPQDWKGWSICGHHHNNNVGEYPFISKAKKQINVSVELTCYKPVDMDEIIEKIKVL